MKRNGTSIHAISFDRLLFSEIRQNVSFRIRQMLLKGQKCRGNLSKWRIDGVFLEMHIEKKMGQVFTRVELLVDLYSLPLVSLKK